MVSSPTVPLRHAPGLSLNNATEPPAQLGVFTDGDGLTAITAFDGRREPLAYLDFTPAALPYHLLEKPDVLILGAGGGADILLALLHGAATIDAVELNPQLVSEHFNPHVTTGVASRVYLDKMLAEPFESFTFSPAGAAVYQLGQFGTAARKLKTWDLKR